jgi:cyclic beta-1,2-glucan synthetase
LPDSIAHPNPDPEQPRGQPSMGPVDADLHALELALSAAQRLFATASELSSTSEGEWYLDNYHVAQEALRQARRDMPSEFYRELPVVETGSGQPHPRIRIVAREIVRRSGNYLDFDWVRRFTRTYQAVAGLTMGELWALPAMLRLAVLESLARAATLITTQQAQGTGAGSADLAADVQTVVQDRTIANCILSLRRLATQDWEAFFESVSRVEHALREDPAGVYGGMDADTRDRYRKVVEKLAKKCGFDEERVAQAAVQAARQSGSRGRQGHVGYYLVDQGRRQLEAQVGYRPSVAEHLARCVLARAVWAYLGSIGLCSAAILFVILNYGLRHGAAWLQLLGIGLLGILPAVALANETVNWIVSHTVAPRRLPSMDFDEGIPPAFRTVVAIPSMLTSQDDVKRLLGQLERHYLGNPDPSLAFVLLTDFEDAPQAHVPDDQALVEQVIAGIRALNKEHGTESQRPFHLFHRMRQWNPSEERWMGWERKRGKLADLNRLLMGDKHDLHFAVQEGDADALVGTRYVITLDSDTILTRGSARHLVATMAHPLNQAEFDSASGRVAAGYTVMQPRLEVWPPLASLSVFTEAFAGDTTVDLYTHATSDVYQDLFAEGIYAGKGIYDVVAFERSLSGRVPTNALLSHDLFEGIQGRAALCTTVTFYEDLPATYLAYSYRQHRWIRGDWQLLPWLFPRVPCAEGGTAPNDLALIDRWKILDNLRRSLLPPALMALLLAGWLWLPGGALPWTLLALLTTAAPLFLAAMDNALGLIAAATTGAPTRCPWSEVVRWLLQQAFLAYEALLNFDAIGSTCVRLFFTHRHLLQWTTSAHTMRLFQRERRLALLWKRMGGASVLAIAIFLLLFWLRPAALPCAAPFLVAWLASPQIALWINHPAHWPAQALSMQERDQLHSIARRTWLYFEQFVSPDGHWLAPDHFQEDPLGQAARRTSPTNIGMQLISSLGAYDLGYIGAAPLAFLLRLVFDNLDQMELHRGHFLNWYDTASLQPLQPRYVSTADSGNLAGCLLALKQGCLDIVEQPIFRLEDFHGLQDELALVAVSLRSLRSQDTESWINPLVQAVEHMHHSLMDLEDAQTEWPSRLQTVAERSWPDFVGRLAGQMQARGEALEAESVRGLRLWVERTNGHVQQLVRDVRGLLPWWQSWAHRPARLADRALSGPLEEAWQALAHALTLAPPLRALPGACQAGARQLSGLRSLLQEGQEQGAATAEALSWCDELAQRLSEASGQALNLIDMYHQLAEDAERYFQDMDFRFLYDDQRRVFHIGYNVSAARMDSNYYDLLASEARLASLLAIAKGHVPQNHWLHMNRPFTRVDGMTALLSWSGTMFEYLMPSLLVSEQPDSLLRQTSTAVVHRQIAYARERGVLWGISESGYYQFDAAMNYQYQAFGVPGLGLKRGLGDDLVVSPYASLLALPVQPRAVLRNLGALGSEGMVGSYGLYESIDYTRSRLAPGQESAIVRSYMAHHQGMIFISIVNMLCDGVMRRRFHADPRVQTTDLLLQERTPGQAPAETPRPAQVTAAREAMPLPSDVPYTTSMRRPAPQTFLLSNGQYTVLLTSAGGGYSQWQDLRLTHWRPDTTLDNYGQWIYVQEHRRNALWSAGYQPTRVLPDWEEVVVYAHKVELRRKDQGVALRLEVAVSPDDAVEVRRLTLTNDANRRRNLWLASYGEVALAPSNGMRHPAFSKLFVQSEYLPEWNAQLFHRRPREVHQEPAYLAHLLVVRGLTQATGAHESDRARFLGRGRDAGFPAAFTRGRRGLTGTTGSTLDGIFSIGQSVDLLPHTSIQVAYVTLAASSREEAMTLARRYQSWTVIRRLFGRARDASREELRELNLSTSALQSMHELLSVLLYPHQALRAEPATLAANPAGQSGLWPFGISGDHPILLVCIKDCAHAQLLSDVLRAHAYWRKRQLKIDLVILNEQETGYGDEVRGCVQRLIQQTGGDAWLNRRGGIFLLHLDQLNEDSRLLLHTAARAILHGDEGSLDKQMAALAAEPTHLPDFTPVLTSAELSKQERPVPEVPQPEELKFYNGLGGFTTGGREYVIYLPPDRHTPLPWINVVANRQFGFLVSESGSGYTWALNSAENRLTPWRNDPVQDEPGEALYLRDEETAEVWSPTPGPAGAAGSHLVRHGAGYSQFEHNSHGLKQRLRLFATVDDPVKVIHLRLENAWHRHRRIMATYYAEWVLGAEREDTQQYVVPEWDAEHNALLARNTYDAEFPERVAFLGASQPLHGLTCDRTEFLGREGSLRRPAALYRIGLSGAVAAGHDPCAAAQIHIDLAPGEQKEVFFLLGQGADRDAATGLVQKYRQPEQVEAAWNAVHGSWDSVLGTVQVETPDPAMDVLLNRWLLYQDLSCRLWARSALYQSSGAYGFRDQLQDVMALVHAAPDQAREHILRAAAHQFEQGDVLHWWHPPFARGVRTRNSDDLLWLPFVTADYVAQTGDESIFSEPVPFRSGDELQPDQVESYGSFGATAEAHNLYEHCLRALDRGDTAGPHSLPLIRSGDWNDGMNRVGVGGRGESVWLGWFLCATLSAFAPLCTRMGDTERAERCRRRAQSLAQALEQHAWDGEWYLRGFFDDGTPLGSAQSSECQITSIAQSWSVLSRIGDPKRQAQAMESVWQRLVRQDERLLLLLTPPFDRSTLDPGYIKAYPPGIRENGGQYTHAALWVAWAFAALGQGDRVGELFRLLNPIHHSATAEDMERYKVEPYVVAADVYSHPAHVGRGGWTWYTGSAGWMYRLGLEAMLGLRRAGDVLRIDPCIPQGWSGYVIHYRHGDTRYQISVQNPSGVNRGVAEITFDGEALPSGDVPLLGDGEEHEVQVRMG